MAFTYKLEHADGTPGRPADNTERPPPAWRGRHATRSRSAATGSSVSLTPGSMRVRTVTPCRCSWSNPPSSVATLELALGTVGAVDGDSLALSLLFDRSS